MDISWIVKRLVEHRNITEVIIECQPGQWLWNRYIGIKRARNKIIYTQDDDCLVNIGSVIRRYQPGIIVNAMKAKASNGYQGRVAPIGWGAVFDKDLIGVLDGWWHDELFLRECDRVFTGLNDRHPFVAEITDLPHATSETRMFKEKRHHDDRRDIERRIERACRLATTA